MKKLFLSIVMMLFGMVSAFAGQWIRINQLGYLPKSIKVAVLISEEPLDLYRSKEGYHRIYRLFIQDFRQ